MTNNILMIQEALVLTIGWLVMRTRSLTL